MAQTLLIDRIRCDGHGMCAELLPELIELEGDGPLPGIGLCLGDGHRAEIEIEVGPAQTQRLTLTETYREDQHRQSLKAVAGGS